MENVLKEVSENIRKLESLKSEMENQIRLEYKTYHALYDLMKKPDRIGHSHEDCRASSLSAISRGEKCAFTSYAYHDPIEDRWGAFVEWTIDGKRGASEPDNYGWFDTPEKALDVSDREARLAGEQSKDYVNSQI